MAANAMKEYLLLLKANDQISSALVKVNKQLLETKQLSKDLLNTQENQKKIKQLEGMQKSYYNQMKNNLKVIGEKKKELSKQEKDDLKIEQQLIKENAKAEKQAVEEIKKANQEKHKQERDYQNQRKRDAQDLNKWIEEERRATNQAYEEKKRHEKELQKLAEQRLKLIKDIGVAMTKTGTAMVGAGVAGFTTASSLGQKYVNNFVEPDRMLAIKSSELNGLSINTFNRGLIELAKRTGMSSKDIGSIMAISSNASNVGGSAKNLETMAKVGYITGASGESLGTASAIYNNRLRSNGWTGIDQFGDALIAFSDLGGASQSSMIQKYTELSNYTGAFDKYDKLATFKALAAVSKMLPGEEGLSIGTTGLRQLLGTDAIKKDLGSVVKTMAKARNMTTDEYAKTVAGVNLNGNKLESQEDLYKLGANYLPLIAKTFEDALSIQGTAYLKNKDGSVEEIRAKELTMDLAKELSGNTRSMAAINAIISAIDNGTWAEVNTKLSDEGMSGRLDKAVKDFNKSDTGKLMMAQTNIKENGMMLLARLAPLLAGVLQKLVEWTDSLAGVDFETLVEEGERLGEIFKTLIQLGIGLFIIGKVTTMFSVLISTVDHTMGILGNFGLSTSVLTKNLGRYWSAAMTNWSLGLNGGLKSVSLLAGSAKTTAGKMAILGAELIALTGAVIWCYNAIKNLADDFAEFGQSKEYLQGREDAYNKKDTASADAYNKMNSTAFGKFFDDLSNGNYLDAVGGLLSTVSPTNIIGSGTSALLTYGSTLQGQEGLNFFQELLAKGYTNYEQLASWAEGQDNKVLDGILSTISPDYNAYNKNQDTIEDVYNQHQGNYVEEGLKDAESYFEKEKNSWDDILKQLEEDDFSTDVPFESLINPDAQDVYDAMEEGAKDGTEKGIKNALSGDYNIPGSYTKLSQNGLAELVGFDNFGVKRTGNTVTMKNDININITADGQNADVIASIVEQRLSEFFRGSTLLDI